MTKRPKPLEQDIQKTVVDILLTMGYEVAETGQSRAPLQGKIMYAIRGFIKPGIEEKIIFGAIGKALRDWAGNTKGLPDLAITRDTWPPCTWIMIEMKKPGGAVDARQVSLSEYGRSAICYSVSDAICEVIKAERSFIEHYLVNSPAAMKVAESRIARLRSMQEQMA